MDISDSDLVLLHEENTYARVPHGMQVAPTRKEAKDWLRKKRQTSSSRRGIIRKCLPHGVDDPDECLIKIAGLFVRYEFWKLITKPGKREQKRTNDIEGRAKHLAGLLRTGTITTTNRILLELTADHDLNRRAEVDKRYDKILKALERLEKAASAADARIKPRILRGRASGRPARAIIDQLASLWSSWTDDEPSDKQSKTKAEFVLLTDKAFEMAKIKGNLPQLRNSVLAKRRGGSPRVVDRRSSESDNVARRR